MFWKPDTIVEGRQLFSFAVSLVQFCVVVRYVTGHSLVIICLCKLWIHIMYCLSFTICFSFMSKHKYNYMPYGVDLLPSSV